MFFVRGAIIDQGAEVQLITPAQILDFNAVSPATPT